MWAGVSGRFDINSSLTPIIRNYSRGMEKNPLTENGGGVEVESNWHKGSLQKSEIFWPHYGRMDHRQNLHFMRINAVRQQKWEPTNR